MTVLKRFRTPSKLEFFVNAQRLRKEVFNLMLRDFSFKDTFPEWVKDNLRKSFWNITENLILNITFANSIYPKNKSEANERRLFQDKAIGNCEQVLKTLEFICDILPCKSQGYLLISDIATREQALIKAWRKSDNKRFAELS